MRLTDLYPCWAASCLDRWGMGLAFDCPTCHADKLCRLVVWFDNPLDEGEPITKCPGVSVAFRRGETFDALSLTPEVNVPGHWVGRILLGGLYDLRS